MSTTEQVWNHHLESFGARDVAECMKDFTEDSLLIVNGEQHKGTEAIGTVFGGLFEALPAGCAFELTNCTILDDAIYITWNAESDALKVPFATDTFIIKDGKIAVQTVGAVMEPKG